jgi:hypothetical protein
VRTTNGETARHGVGGVGKLGEPRVFRGAGEFTSVFFDRAPGQPVPDEKQGEPGLGAVVHSVVSASGACTCIRDRVLSARKSAYEIREPLPGGRKFPGLAGNVSGGRARAPIRPTMKTFFFALLFLASCSKKDDPAADRRAPGEIASSLKANATPQGTFTLTLKKASLGKAFLLYTSLWEGALEPAWNDLAPVVVSFEVSGGKLGIFELKRNVTADGPLTEALLDTFPILSQTDDEIIFSWEMGLHVVPNVANMGNPDKEEDKDLERGQDDVIRVKESLTRSAVIVGNEMRVEQSFRYEKKSHTDKVVRKNGRSTKESVDSSREVGVTAHFTLRPYEAHPTFQPRAEDDSDSVGFFSTPAPKAGQTEIEHLAQRWDLDPSRGPITYWISANTPEAHRAAMTEGVLYWNRVLGRDVFQVKVGGDARAIPEERSVLVHWINFDNADMAWASTQADPFTGEILRGQLYIPSAFPAAALARLTGDTEAPRFPASRRKGLRLTVANLKSAVIPCRAAVVGYDPDPAPPEVRARMVEDRLRALLAHETGHSLGLRHNFAGSFGSKLPTTEHAQILEKLDADPDLPGAPVSASVMDYHIFRDAVLVGRYIGRDVLAYDRRAIGWGYLGEKLDGSSLPYCTDEHIDEASDQENLDVFGCARYDTDANPLLGKLLEQRMSMRSEWFRMNRRIVGDLFPPRGEKSESVDDAVKRLQDLSNYDYVATPKKNTVELLKNLLQSRKNDGDPSERVQILDIPSAKAGLKNSHFSTYFDSSLGDLAAKYIGEAGGLDDFFLRASWLDPATGLPDREVITHWVSLGWPDWARTGKTPDGVLFEVSAGDWARLRAAAVERAVTKAKSEVQSSLYSLALVKDAQTEDEEGNRSKYSTAFGSFKTWDQKVHAALVKKLTLVFEASDATEKVHGARGDAEIAKPAYESYARQRLLEIYDHEKWGLPYADPSVDSARTELMARRLAWLQKLAALDGKPPAPDADVDVLDYRIQDLRGKGVISQDISDAARTELNGLKYLKGLK